MTREFPSEPSGLAPYVFLHSYHTIQATQCMMDILNRYGLLDEDEATTLTESMAVLLALQARAKSVIAPDEVMPR